jgi:hypothetical protein
MLTLPGPVRPLGSPEAKVMTAVGHASLAPRRVPRAVRFLQADGLGGAGLLCQAQHPPRQDLRPGPGDEDAAASGQRAPGRHLAVCGQSLGSGTRIVNSTASYRFCHRWKRSATWITSGAPSREPSNGTVGYQNCLNAVAGSVVCSVTAWLIVVSSWSVRSSRLLART